MDADTHPTASARWRADRERYGPRAWFREQSLWAVALLRFGQWVDELPSRAARLLGSRAYWLAYRPIQTITGIGINKNIEVGGGLRIHHFGGIFVAEGVRIGERCTMRQGVTLGERLDGGAVPQLGDDVELGAYAQVLGGVRVGNGARIGAMSVVLRDVEPGATVVGNPARPVERKAPGAN